MSSETSSRHQRPRYGSPGAYKCGYAAPLPDFTVDLTVTYKGGMVAQAVDLERADVPEELHRLSNLYPLSAGYDITALVKERAS